MLSLYDYLVEDNNSAAIYSTLNVRDQFQLFFSVLRDRGSCLSLKETYDLLDTYRAAVSYQTYTSGSYAYFSISFLNSGSIFIIGSIEYALGIEEIPFYIIRDIIVLDEAPRLGRLVGVI